MAITGEDYVNYLKQFIGTPYVWGGQNPGGFDCSGLLVYGAKHFGLNIGGRTTYEQIGHGQAVDAKGLRVGDLVFFDTDGSVAGPDHVGVYAGNGQMLHAPRPGKSVELADMTGGYWMGKFMGGRRISGVIATGGNANDFTEDPKTIVKLTPEELAASYGWAIGFMESNPELKKLFKSAVAETWTSQKFQAEVRNTTWWKTTSEKAREAQAMESADPATWRATVEATKVQVQKLAAEMGASVPTGKMDEIVQSVIRTGMDEDLIRNALGGYIQFQQDGTLRGEAAMHEYVIREYAAKQGVKLDDDTIKQQAQLISRKLASVDDFKVQIAEQAKSAFPGYTEQIDGGMTMEDLSAPYKDVMAKLLELPDTSITLDDPEIKSALNGVNKDGKPVGLTLSQFQNMLRSDPRWKGTQNAQSDTMNAAVTVLKDIGLSA